MKNKIMTMMMAALAFTACTEEDLMQPTYSEAGTLHIASVTIDGQDVARSRVVADGGTFDGTYPFNQSYNGFTNGNKLQLVTSGLSGYDSDGNAYSENTFYAIYNADGTWSITVQSDYTTSTPVTLKPAEGTKWADASIEAAFGGDDVSGTDADVFNNHVAPGLGVVQGDIPVESSIIFSDWLVASTTDGTVSIDTDVKSPTLGTTTITLKHAHALLRLPVSADNVTDGTYIVDGTAYNVTGLGTLWAVLNTSNTTAYIPLTRVTIGEEGDYLQAIVPSTSTDGAYTLTGFKAVMNTSEEGETLTLDLPFKVDDATTASTGITLEPNHQYPLTLNIAPHTASVSLSSGLGKPGWDVAENELSNELNESVEIDGTATDVDAVKADIEAAIAAGKRIIYVTGETLAEYSYGDNAYTVVGEAISQLASGTTVSLVLPDATSIGDQAFYKCTALTSVSAPKATSIGDDAFYNCKAITSVSAPAATSIGDKAFWLCSALTSVSAPAATSIGDKAFSSCSALKSVSIDAAKTIESSAFYKCTALTSVSAPKATSIGDDAFSSCTALTSVYLPAANTIGDKAFSSCSALASLTLGAVTSVKTYISDNEDDYPSEHSFLGASTENCDLTLGTGSTGSPEEGENKTWAGKTWKSITLK